MPEIRIHPALNHKDEKAPVVMEDQPNQWRGANNVTVAIMERQS